jgi:hypothetical protein
MPRKSKYTAHEKWFIGRMRQVAAEWPVRQDVLNAARRGPDRYECAGCRQCFHRSRLHVDHSEPVIDPEAGWQGMGVYVERLFCSIDKLQALCTECHHEKTQAENTVRRAAAKKRLTSVSE